MTPSLQFFKVSTEIPPWLSWKWLEAQSEQSGELDRTAAEVFRQATPLIVDRLLRAENPLDFEGVLDGLLADPAVADAYWLMVAATIVEPLPSLEPSAALLSEVPAFFGAPAASLLAEGREDLFGQAEAFGQLVAQLPAGGLRRIVDNLSQKHSLDWFVTEADEPPVLIEMALRWTEGGVCGLALALALQREECLPAWLGLLLAERCVDGARAYVRYVGSLPGVTMTRPLPPSERLDLARLWREHQEANWGLRLSMLQHRAGGQAISAPFGELPDDD